MVSPEIIARLKSMVGEQGFTEDPAEIAPHLIEWRGTWRGHTPLLLQPKNTAEVSAILSLCDETRTPPLGLEVVLADGRVLDMVRVLHKDNTGYDLKQLFIGAEGTLGVITVAALKLFPKPETVVTALIGCPTPDAAVALLRRFQQATGALLSAFEFFPRDGLELVIAHIP